MLIFKVFVLLFKIILNNDFKSAKNIKFDCLENLSNYKMCCLKNKPSLAMSSLPIGLVVPIPTFWLVSITIAVDPLLPIWTAVPVPPCKYK